MDLSPVILEGERVRLEPLRPDHFDVLCEIGLIEELWMWTANVCRTASEMQRYINDALEEKHRGVSLPFVTIDRESDKIVGSTRFGNIDVNNRRTEIGWTWITPAWQKSYINTEAKFLMLEYAFETWNCIRVELKTDALNQRSRNAMVRIGAKEEGTLRKHMITESGRFRDTVYFSIVDNEWAAVKQRLSEKIRSSK